MQRNGTEDQTDVLINEWLQNSPEVRHHDRACKQGHQYSGAKDAGIGMNEADVLNLSSQHHSINSRGNVARFDILEQSEDINESDSEGAASVDGDEGAHDHTITGQNNNLAQLNICFLSLARHSECACHLLVVQRPYGTAPYHSASPYASPYASGMQTPTSMCPEHGSNEHSLTPSMVLSSRSMSTCSMSTRSMSYRSMSFHSMSTSSILPFVGHHFITDPLRLTQGAEFPYPTDLNITADSDHDVEVPDA